MQTPDPSPPLVVAVAKPTAPPSASSACSKPGAKCIALTFDDGPGPYTAEVVQELSSSGSRATFFVLGSNVAGREQVLARMVAAGMEIGNHSWSHRLLTHLSDSAERSEVDRTASAVRSVTGVEPVLLRPPYGALDASTRSLGLPIALWDVDTEDWRRRDSAAVTAYVLSKARPGAVVLLHDIHPTSTAAVPSIVSALRERGYSLVTMSELMASCGGVRPGRVASGC